MKVFVYSARSYDREFLKAANQGIHQLQFVEARLEECTTALARQYPAVCCFVDDILNKKTIKQLSDGGTQLVTLRATGFNNVDLEDVRALISALEKRRLGSVGLDVYEEESHIFYQDLSDEIIPDTMIMRLLTFPNALVTGHQAFFTNEAMDIIARTTIKNISDFTAGRKNENIVKAQNMLRAPVNKK